MGWTRLVEVGPSISSIRVHKPMIAEIPGITLGKLLRYGAADTIPHS